MGGLEAEFKLTGNADGVRALRCPCGPCPPGLGACLDPTGVEGRDAEPLVVVGSGSWVGFLGDEGAIWMFLLGAETEPFLDSVGVHAGEAL